MFFALPVAAALAQDTTPEQGFDAHGFRFVGSDADLRDPAQFVRPGASSGIAWSAGGVAEYANRPVVFEDASGTRTAALSNVLALNLAGGVSPIAPLRFDLSLPVYLSSASDLAGTEGPAIGDLRLQTVASALRPGDDGGLGLGLLASLDLPTGDADRYLGTTGVAGTLGLVGTVESGSVTASWQVDARLAPNTDPEQRPAPTLGGDTVGLAGGVSTLLGDSFGLGVEAHAAVPIDPAVMAAIGLPAEAMLTGRLRTESGGYGLLGLGVGLGAGAGASPIRLVVGGGFGTSVTPTPRDSDLDGLADKLDGCPDEAETVNGYLEEDGCADALPTVTFVAKLGGEPAPEAALSVVGPSGTVEGVGQVTASGLPGQKVVASAKLGACRVGTLQGVVPQTNGTTLELPLSRQDATVVVSATDAAGRPLEGIQVRYVIADEACRPADSTVRAGRGIHLVGTGPVKVFVTAMGYDVAQVAFDLQPGEQHLVEAKLKPTSVSYKGDRIHTNQAIAFASGTATLDAKAAAILDQVASLVLIQNDQRKITVTGWSDVSRDAKRVSQQRADAVMAALVASGVAPEQLEAVGKGLLPRGQTQAIQLTLGAVPAVPVPTTP